MTLNNELLKRLCETPGIPGREAPIREVVREEMEKLVDEIRVDAMGNLIGIKRGGGKRRVMLSAHMDQIGFIVRFVDSKGFLRLQPVGGFDPKTLVSQRVVVYAEKGQLPGVMGVSSKPIHLQSGEDKPPKIEEFYIDLGLPGEKVKELVAIGDPIVLDRGMQTMGDCVVSKALDDRLGVYVMLEALRKLDKVEADIYAVASVQEEVGLRGAIPAAFGVEPDVGIALDVTLAVDGPGAPEHEAVTSLGQGIGIKLMDARSISNHGLVQRFKSIAQRDDIPHQMEILPRGGTDAAGIQASRAGVPAITLSVPTRYVHTVNEMAHTTDIQAGIDLLAAFLKEAQEGEFQPG